MSDETVICVLHGAGYRLLDSRKRGLLKNDDFKKRRKFSDKVAIILTDKFWEEGISYYIEATGFQHNYNPHHETQSIRTMS